MLDWYERPPQPMAAYLAAEPFDSPDLIYEARWDGLRAMLAVRSGESRIICQAARDVTSCFPELERAHEAISAREALIDGVVIGLVNGRPNRDAIAGRLRSDTAATDDAKPHPAVFVAFDLLVLDGRPLLGVRLSDRKDMLKGILRQTPNIVLGTWVRGSGLAFLRQVGKVGIRGVVAKDLSSVYEPGTRSRAWLRMQRIKEQDCVICGFTEGMGRREGLLGSLVLGVWRDGKLVHAGQVGSGFDHATVIDLHQQLVPLVTEAMPFDEMPKIDRSVAWVEPVLTCEVQYHEWTADRKLRSPRFVRLQLKRPEDCEVEEVPVPELEDQEPSALSA